MSDLRAPCFSDRWFATATGESPSANPQVRQMMTGSGSFMKSPWLARWALTLSGSRVAFGMMAVWRILHQEYMNEERVRNWIAQ